MRFASKITNSGEALYVCTVCRVIGGGRYTSSCFILCIHALRPLFIKIAIPSPAVRFDRQPAKKPRIFSYRSISIEPSGISLEIDIFSFVIVFFFEYTGLSFADVLLSL